MEIICFLKGSRGEVCLTEMLRSGHDVVAVVTSGVDEKLQAICSEHNLPLHNADKPNTPQFAETLKSINADLFILIGFNKILKPIIFEIPPLGTINLHGGRLPQYRGAAPINWQIINGERVGGCCILFVDKGIDTAPIIQQELYEISEEDTHQSVLEKTLQIFPRLLLSVLGDFERSSAQATPQDLNEGSYFARRHPEDSKINWNAMDDLQVHNLVRGMQGPYPHAFTYRAGEKVEIEYTSLLDQEITGISGRVVAKRNNGVIVVCQNRGLLVTEARVNDKLVKPNDVFKLGDMLG